MPDPNPISLSEDRLRAILAEFKLDLIERLQRELGRKADQAHLDALEKRVDVLEAHGSRDAREAHALAMTHASELAELDAWRNRVVGAIAVLTAIVLPTAFVVLSQVLNF